MDNNNTENMQIFDTVEYRGFKVDIFIDDPGQCFFCTFDGEPINFGTYNCDYEEDLKYFIDRKLDTIYRFPEFPGSSLQWFDNAGFWDIELLHRERIIDVWLVGDRSLDDAGLKEIVAEAESKLAWLKENRRRNNDR